MGLESILKSLLLGLDPVLILPYRLVGDPMLGFLLGTFCLCLACVVLGALTVSAAFRLNRRHLEALTGEVSRKEALSLQAYADGDRESYRALNKETNEAWGRYFFTMAAYSAGLLWPLPFALAWMQSRFAEVSFRLPFPLDLALSEPVGYPFVFIPTYILARILFKAARRGKPRLRSHPV